MEKTFQHSQYLEHIVQTQKRKETVRKAVEALHPYTFDAIAVTGLSGWLIGPEIASAMDKEILAVRKGEHHSHGRYGVEGIARPDYYVIVDDLVDSGDTARRILEAVGGLYPASTCIGVLEVNALWGVWHISRRYGRWPLGVPRLNVDEYTSAVNQKNFSLMRRYAPTDQEEFMHGEV